MENRYPLFAGGRILKKEALWDMRTYAYGSQQAIYAGYTDGIIKGCGIHVKGSHLAIGKGILKYGDFIYQIQEEVMVPFTAENRMVALKALFSVKTGHPDYLSYQADFRLDYDLERRENQIELCRFQLREGSVLRDAYKDFSDLQTGYDTINLINATVAGRRQERLHPAVLLRFAEEMQERGGKDTADMVFSYEIWNHAGELERAAVLAYLSDKGSVRMAEMCEWDNERIVSELEGILLEGGRTMGREREKNIIYVE
ncbi:MAG: hypothetical protein HDR14_14130 [Lachnospiraceae bacterium]|nr:hypothetical protein [Lachnospiraceae bacterium]